MFEEVCPYYLQYGMTYDQFWHGDPWMVRAYRKKWRLELQAQNYNAWLQGLYFYDALSTALANALSKQKHSYIEEPIRIFPMTAEERKANAEKEYRKMMNQLEAMARRAGYTKKEE